MHDAMFVHNGQERRRNGRSIVAWIYHGGIFSNGPASGQDRTGEKSDICDCLVYRLKLVNRGIM